MDPKPGLSFAKTAAPRRQDQAGVDRYAQPSDQHELITRSKHGPLAMRLSFPYVGRSTGGGVEEDERPCIVFTSPPRVGVCDYTRISSRSGVRRAEALCRRASCEKIPWLHLSALSRQIVCRCRRDTADRRPTRAELLHC